VDDLDRLLLGDAAVEGAHPPDAAHAGREFEPELIAASMGPIVRVNGAGTRSGGLGCTGV